MGTFAERKPAAAGDVIYKRALPDVAEFTSRNSLVHFTQRFGEDRTSAALVTGDIDDLDLGRISVARRRAHRCGYLPR